MGPCGPRTASSNSCVNARRPCDRLVSMSFSSTLLVKDGEVTYASMTWDTSKFSKQMWDPFVRWVLKTYPDDAAVMFNADQTDYQLTPESIRLWDERTREYVKAVQQGTA